MAFDAVLDYVRNNGAKPRYRGNRLIFLAAEHSAQGRLSDCIRVALAWKSIVDDVKDGRLNIDLFQKQQAEKELQAAESVLPRVARECYKWLLCPVQHSATDTKPTVEAFPLNTSGSALGNEIERVCTENELVITTWSPIHLRAKLGELYWKDDKRTVGAMAFWEDTMRYLYLPRMKDRNVLQQAIVKGVASRDFFGTAYGHRDGKFDGFKLGDPNIQFDDTLLLIELEAATAYEAAQAPAASHATGGSGPAWETGSTVSPPPSRAGSKSKPPPAGGPLPGGPVAGEPKARAFIGTVDVKASSAKMRLVQIAEEILAQLVSDPQAVVNVTLEISAEFPNGVSDQVKRAVSENATSLGFKNKTWE